MAKLADAEISTHYFITIHNILIELYCGAMVKRSRHLPFTEESRVRFSVASPAISFTSLWIAITHTGYHVPNRDTPTPLKTISIILEIDIHIITLLKVINIYGGISSVGRAGRNVLIRYFSSNDDAGVWVTSLR